MIPLPFRRPSRNPTIRALYGMIVAQARSPAFYRDLGRAGYGPGPDRDDHAASGPGSAAPAPGPRADAARSAGVVRPVLPGHGRQFPGNGRRRSRVPKEMRSIAEAFYGRARVYDAALDAGDDEALTAALWRETSMERAGAAGARRDRRLYQEAVRRLAATPIETVLARARPRVARIPGSPWPAAPRSDAG